MNPSFRNLRAIRAILALAVFASWLGGALFHNHDAASASCKVCQVLQANQADLPSHGSVPRPSVTSDLIATQTSVQAAYVLLLAQRGRAPPLA